MLLRNPSRRALTAAFGLTLALGATPASADSNERKECADAYAEAQQSMRSTALLKARDQLKVCARDSCLALIRKDCVAWLDEVNAGIPSVVVAAKGPNGKETLDVRVSVNGEEVASKLDVKAIELDPGTFTMRFERPGSAPIEKEVVLRQGQKNKLVEVDFGVSKGDKRRAILPWILGGVGVGLMAGGAAFWLKSESDRSDLQGSCAPRCAQDDVDSIKTQRVVGDVLFGVGVVVVGTAAVWLLTDPSRNKSSSAAFLTPRGFVF
jgi:hypothetical protein